MALTPTQRWLLDVQGFEDAGDWTLERTQAWLRLAPALCATIAAIGVVLASPPVLWTLAAFALAGAALPFHPFDLIYTLGVRRITRRPALPPNRAPRRFACALASAWLLATGALFAGDYDIAGCALGATLVALATLVATTHICVASFVFRAACRQSLSPRLQRT